MQSQTWTLPADLEAAVKGEIQAWQEAGKVRRLWERDASLWTGTDEASWLGWLGLPEEQIAQLDHLKGAQEDARAGSFDHVLLLGMGGSSLCPEVLRMTFGRVAGFPELHVLDSTDPAQIRAVERRLDPAKTLFIVSSKSGTTLEPNIFKDYFFDRVRRAVGEESAGSHFIAITDPRSKLHQVAETAQFRHVYLGVPSVGGRYSALSQGGRGGATALGACTLAGNVSKQQIQDAQKDLDLKGKEYGVELTTNHGPIRLTFYPDVAPALRRWAEEGRGIVPVDREPSGDTAVYGADRLFVYLRLEPNPDLHQDEHVAALERAGHPVVRIRVGHRYDLGQEFFRWEFATAVAGSIIGIDAFNQPDVEASKVATRKLTEQYERAGMLAPEAPILEGDGLRLYADGRNAAQLMAVPGARSSIVGALRAHFERLRRGDYAAFLAYIEMSEAHEQTLQAMRRMVRDGKHVATCLGFGPRFLHSTGQAYKGGPNSGVFLQIT